LHQHTHSNMLFNKIFKTYCVWILSCSGSWVGDWFIIQLVFLTFWLISLVFFTTFCILITAWIITSFNCKCPLMCVHTSHWPCGYPSFHYAHGNKHMKTHDVSCDIFVTIVQSVNFHMGWEPPHALFLTMFKSCHYRINIVLTKDEIRTPVDIVIIDPMWTDLLPWSCTTQRFVAFWCNSN
jgi:hypothetical protein